MTGRRPLVAERFRLHHALEYGAWGGLVVNLLLVPTFWLAGITPLALFSVGSVALYLCCGTLLKRRRVTLVVGLIFFEIAVHVPLVAYVIGGDGGFQYYLLAIVPLIFVAAPRNPMVSSGLALMLGGLFVGLDMLSRSVPPLWTLDPHMLAYIRYTNILAAFGLASFVAWGYGLKIVRGERELAAAANTDLLTGLSSRRYATRQIEREMSRSDRSGAPAVLALVDIDLFKAINDEHGHDVGDQVIVAVSNRLRDALRSSDLAARWGGEEFLLVLPEATARSAAAAAERIRRAIADHPMTLAGHRLDVSVTIGLAERLPGEPLSSWINRADQALYAGKGSGRNRVSVSSPAVDSPVRMHHLQT